MKKWTIITLMLVTSALSYAEDELSLAAATQKAPVGAIAEFSPEELAFAARLNDQNRRAFVEKLTAEQRKAAMDAVKDAAVAHVADEVVSSFWAQ